MVVRIKCGQLYILSTDYFSLVCEFCEDSFYTLEELRVHLCWHFPELPTNVKNEVSESGVAGIQDDMTDALNIDKHKYAESKSTSLSIVNNKETKKSKQIEGKQRKCQPKRACKLQPTIKYEQDTILNLEMSKEARYNPRKVVQKAIPLALNAFNKNQAKESDQINDTIKLNSIQSLFTFELELQEDCKLYSVNNKLTSPEIIDRKKTYSCDYCQKEFKTKETIRQHIMLHSGFKPYKCNHCHKTFAQKAGKYHHEKNCYNRSTCSINSNPGAHRSSEIVFNNKLRSPKIKDRKKIYSLSCDYCQKEFKTKETIRQHIMLHSGFKPYKCNHCHKTFAQNAGKYHHERYCYKRMTCNSNPGARRKQKHRKNFYKCRLQLHVIQAHPNDQKHICRVCEKSFSRKDALEYHIRSNHLSDTDPLRYFLCNLCDVKCKSYYELQRHSQTHKSRIFTCDYCRKQFTKKKTLLNHMRIHSG